MICRRLLTTSGGGNWKTIIGLEVHAQLASKHKLFSAALNETLSSSANINVAPFDAAVPGSLPILNPECVELAVRAALAFGCSIQQRSLFERKHYHYADLPAGYQITQNSNPFALAGSIPTEPVVRLKQIQIEQDTAKSSYSADGELVLLDLNRCGVGLIEIVTEPEMHSSQHAVSAAKYIRDTLVNLGVCKGVLAHGHIRFDVNVSVTGPMAPSSAPPLGVRVEIKNINTFSGLAKAIEYEATRQISLLESGRLVRRETRSYDDKVKQTVASREKEGAPDYRFMAEFDLPPLLISEEMVESSRKAMTETSTQEINRIASNYNITIEQASVLLSGCDQLLQVFEGCCCAEGGPVKLVYDFLTNKYLGLSQRYNRRLPNAVLIEIIHKLADGTLSQYAAQEVLTALMRLDEDQNDHFHIINDFVRAQQKGENFESTLPVDMMETLMKLAVENPKRSSLNCVKIAPVLKELKSANLTKEVLEKSKLGVELNKLRKQHATSDKEICDLATVILMKWREIMLAGGPEAKSTKLAKSVKRTAPIVGDEDGDDEDKEEKKSRLDTPSEASMARSDSSVVMGANKDISKDYMVDDAVRDKCFQMLITALTIDSPDLEADELILSTCRSIENSLFTQFGGQINAAYKSKFRSKYLNLKDKANVTLRKAVLSGVISAERFCAMNAAEMASDARRREDRKLVEQNLREAKAAQDNEAETDQFRCGRCGQRKTKYYQLQTRSADEPMTTFVTCINCGNRWKFC